MNLGLFIATFAWGLLIGAIDLFDGIERYKKWLKKKELIGYFPTWEGTKKPLIWYIIWVFIDCLNLPLFIGFAIFGDDTGALLACALIVVGYMFVVRIIYLIVFFLTRNVVNKKQSKIVK
ncbi:MAG: hypothetical protein J6A38_02995 [Clostridia bacterium]|nr:hypothetical protein [Clostridia bacterium]